MIEAVIGLLMFVNGEIKEHRIQTSMAQCLRGKREAERQYSKLGPMKMVGVANKSLKKGEKVILGDINFCRTSQTTDISQVELLEYIKKPLQKDLEVNTVFSSIHF